MSIIEALKKVVHGDQLLGGAIRRSCWMSDVFVLVEPQSNRMQIGTDYDSLEDYTACMEDILAEDWEYAAEGVL